MDNQGEIIAPGTLRFKRLLPGPIERVWAYLTDSEKRGKWLAKGNMELYIGGKVELNFFHADLSPHREIPPAKYKCYETGDSFSGEVIACSPPRLLSFTWGDHSEVTFELSEQENNLILLILTHRKIEDKMDTRISIASGWHTHLGILDAHLNGRIPEGFWEVHNNMEKEYDRLFSK